jgi:hypothetical protein
MAPGDNHFFDFNRKDRKGKTRSPQSFQQMVDMNEIIFYLSL